MDSTWNMNEDWL